MSGVRRWRRKSGIDLACYRDKRWQWVKIFAHARAKHRCQDCGVTHRKLQCHHIKPLLKGGEPFNLDNIVVLCFECHMLRHGRGKQHRPDDGAWREFEEELFL